jgi:hypothetical protein
MLFERFTDPDGTGKCWTCILCGERVERMLNPSDGTMTDPEVLELMYPGKIGQRQASRSVWGDRE